MRSNSKDFKNLLNNPTWKDVEDEIRIWIEEIRNNLESDDIPVTEVPTLRGAIKALRNVLNMPHVLVEQLKEEEENNDGNE